MKNYFVLLCLLTLASCDKCNQPKADDTVKETKQVVVNTPAFNSDSAYYYIQSQLDFGTREMNSKGHEDCAKWLIEKSKQFADTVFAQKFDAKGFDGKVLKCTNIIASINPEASARILLCSHWDSRPWADQDSKDADKPILAANDGASGVAVLMEISRLIKSQSLKNIGVDIFFIDAEDYGQSGYEDSYCLGSQYWGRNTHHPGYKADFGILLDMVGAPNAVFAREGNSSFNAAWVLDKVWTNAEQLGYSNFFSNQEIGAITDDHVYINQLAKIPTIDIIHYDPSSPSGTFGSYWHTHADNMDAIDKNTLNAVGRTLLYTVYQYEAEHTSQ
ncbi:MAG: M28 family peptidase [Bacteroidota bacterium]